VTDLEAHHLESVRRILRAHVPDVEARVYGSRVRGGARKYSDLDVALVADGRIDPARIERLRDAFAGSDLPFQVDVLDLLAVPERFRRAIEGTCEVLQEAEPARRRPPT
jgi:predicted nucleotidyltransferase